MDIQDIIKKIIDGVDSSWSKDTIIRYAYIEAGKELSKNTDFFFSLDNKLGSKNLSYEELKAIYEDDKRSGDLEIICRSGAYILKQIFDHFGIESNILKSSNNLSISKIDDKELYVYHWLLVVKGEKGNYFLSLASDLPNIKFGLQTKRFASHTPKFMKKRTGEIVEVYEGEEIPSTCLEDEYIREIDARIGYLKDYYKYGNNKQKSKEWQLQYGNAGLAMLRDENELYRDESIYNTEFYQKLTCFEGVNGRMISFNETPKEEITKEDWECWIKLLSSEVLDKLRDSFGYFINTTKTPFDKDWNYEEWLKEICTYIQGFIYSYLADGNLESISKFKIDENWDYSTWSKGLKTEFGAHEAHDNPLSILDKLNSLVSMVKNGSPTKSPIELLKLLSVHFLNSNQVYNDEGMVSSEYIKNKFKTLFQRILECGTGPKYLNTLDYSEQIAMIKEITNAIFGELKKDNSTNVPDYKPKYSAVNNRIHFYPIKHKETGEYDLIICIVGETPKENAYYFYDMTNNEFELANILSISANYIVVSNRLKEQIENVYHGMKL